MGHFDKKNICIEIEVRENLTVSRIVDFVEKEKNWNFSIQEFDDFYDSLSDDQATNEKSLRIIQFFVDYKDGILLPDKWGSYEPLRDNFYKEDVLCCAQTLSYPSGDILFKKKRKFDVSIENRYWALIWKDGKKTVPKGKLPEYLGGIRFRFSKQRKIDMDFLEQLVCDFCSYLNTDRGYIYDQENLTILFDVFHPEKVGTKMKPRCIEIHM